MKAKPFQTKSIRSFRTMAGQVAAAPQLDSAGRLWQVWAGSGAGKSLDMGMKAWA
jgi:hypothetical protein